MAKRTYIKFTLGPGTARFPYLHKPDTEGKFASNKYKVTLLLDPADEEQIAILHKAVQKAAEAEWPNGTPEGANMPIKEVDGFVAVEAKTIEAPGLFDARGRKLANGVFINGGDLVRIKASAAAYVGAKEGVTVYLNGVQLIEKRAGGEDSFESFDGGFENPEEEVEQGFAPDDNPSSQHDF